MPVNTAAFEITDRGGLSNGLTPDLLRTGLTFDAVIVSRVIVFCLQYYVEHMLDYNQHRDSLPSGLSRDRDRHLVTVRLTKLLMNQNLRCSIFTYFSPSDKDSYMRPNINYKVSDNLAMEVGANIFFGDYPSTFFGQFQNNTNIYTALRYSF